jgi:hypothetical protein
MWFYAVKPATRAAMLADRIALYFKSLRREPHCGSKVFAVSDSLFSFETNDVYPKSPRLEVAQMLLGSCIYSAVQKPVDGASQLINRVAGRELVQPLHIAEEPMEVPVGSNLWISQQIGAGLGSAFDYAVLSKLTRIRPLSSIGSASTGLLQRANLSLLASQPVRLMAAGFAFEGIATPVHADETDGFWRARLRNATNGGVALGSMAATSAVLDKIQTNYPSLRTANRLALQLPASMLTAGIGGLVTAETQSLLSNQRLASTDELLKSSSSYMLGSLLLPRRSKSMFVMPANEKTGLNISVQLDRMKQGLEDAGLWSQAEPMVGALQQRASERQMSEQELARTYRNVGRFYQDRADAPVNVFWQKQLGLQSLHHAAYPGSIDQGSNSTCIVGALQSSIFTTSPADAIRTIANIALDGKFKNHNGNLISFLKNKDDLQPDDEASHVAIANIGNGRRTFASQLFQLGATNSYWQAQDASDQGRHLGRGQLSYRISGGTGVVMTSDWKPISEKTGGNALLIGRALE